MKLFILFNGTFSYRIIGYKLSLSKGEGGSRGGKTTTHRRAHHTKKERRVPKAGESLPGPPEKKKKRGVWGGISCASPPVPHLPGCPRRIKRCKQKKASLPSLIKMDVSPSRVRKA